MSNGMIKGFAVISLWAEDVLVTTHFYKDVLGLELSSHHHAGQPHFRVGGTLLTILKGKPLPAQDSDPPRFPLLAFRVHDLAAAVERLMAHGVELPWGVEGTGDTRWVMLRDPAGNLIELTG